MKQSIGSKLYRIKSNLRDKRIKAAFNKNISAHKPIVVFQMGKVASMTIYNSLKEQYPGITLHRHVLTDPDDWQARVLLNHAINEGKPLLIITMMREPIGRNISAFFQNFEAITGIKPADAKYSNNELKDIFFTNKKMDHEPPYTWFDKNIKKHFGLDIFGAPFPKEKGWARFKRGNLEVLLMKAEISDDVKIQLLKEVTGLTNFQLKASNISEDKDYADMYASFKKEIVIPTSYLDQFYNSPKIRYFYTDEEIAAMRKKWKSS